MFPSQLPSVRFFISHMLQVRTLLDMLLRNVYAQCSQCNSNIGRNVPPRDVSVKTVILDRNFITLHPIVLAMIEMCG